MKRRPGPVESGGSGANHVRSPLRSGSAGREVTVAVAMVVGSTVGSELGVGVESGGAVAPEVTVGWVAVGVAGEPAQLPRMSPINPKTTTARLTR